MGTSQGSDGAAGMSQWAEPGAKEARMSSLPSRRAGDGAASPLLLHPKAAAERESSWAFPPTREPVGVKGTVEMVWGAGAMGDDEDRADFLSSSLGGGLVPPS